MEFGIEEYALLIIKRNMRNNRIGLSNQERIRTPGEKENYKYLAILEVDNIKQTGWKNTPKERDNFSMTSSIADISSKG